MIIYAVLIYDHYHEINYPNKYYIKKKDADIEAKKVNGEVQELEVFE